MSNRALEIFFLRLNPNSHQTKIKMAADLAAAYLIDSVGLLTFQVGLEPTTLRLSVRDSLFSWLLIVALYCS